MFSPPEVLFKFKNNVSEPLAHSISPVSLSSFLSLSNSSAPLSRFPNSLALSLFHSSNLEASTGEQTKRKTCLFAIWKSWAKKKVFWKSRKSPYLKFQISHAWEGLGVLQIAVHVKKVCRIS
jgi:hypothetical protein